jgi:hypothetical protein
VPAEQLIERGAIAALGGRDQLDVVERSDGAERNEGLIQTSVMSHERQPTSAISPSRPW